MHNDPERCAKESSYGGALVHGFFMLSLLIHFMRLAGIMRPFDADYSLNYGLGKMRVLRPVVVGDGICIRDRIILLDVTEREHGCKQKKLASLLEVKGDSDPVLYA